MTMQTWGKYQYRQISAAPEIHDSARWDTPRQYQGQMMERQFSTGAPTRAGQGLGDRYARVHDRSTGAVTYYELVTE